MNRPLGAQSLVLALSKGRILDETLPLLQKVGVDLAENPNATRKLVLPTNRPDLSVVVIRPADVPTFVEHGVADLGVAGKDVLLEHGANGLYELMDLGLARCRLMVARPKVPLAGERAFGGGRLRVATKFTRIAKSYFHQSGRQVEIIKLYGSMELAPIVGLADCIVDVVDTGKTLRANNLEPVETIMDVSSRLVVNKASMKLKHPLIKGLMKSISASLA